MSTYHHSHPHRYGRRGVHEHHHGHRGEPPAPRRAPVPWSHWFAEHAHIHIWQDDEDSIEAPPEPGEGGER